jgi:phospholipase C
VIAALLAAAALGQPVMGSPIAHVIVVIQENRTFDNLFASSTLANGGPFPGADASQTATIDGKQVTLKALPFEDPYDPDHAHPALLAEWNNGKLDGWPQQTLAYVPDHETYLYHMFAHAYALADENFSPRLIPTFPGHLFLVAAQSEAADDPTDLFRWGCDSAAGTTVPIFGAGETEIKPGKFPCFDYQTIGDLLDRAHVSWKYYAAQPGTMFDSWENVYDAINHVRYGPDWSNVSMPMSNVLSDIASCKLPQVAYVTPTWTNSDHAAELTNGGPAWVGSMYMAILQSQINANPACRYYGNTAIIVTWDDSGGWYDHVAPPAGPNGTQLGFRVPILVISAWSKSDYVSHTQRESTSIVRYIEKNWELGNLGQRDASGDDLTDMFDYARSQPIPPFKPYWLARAIRDGSPRWNLAASLRDTHWVDDQ